MRIEAPAPRRRTPSLTPLIDVVFILLVFFMLVSSFVEWRAMELSTPAETSAAAADTKRETFRLRVLRDALELNGQRVTAARLGERLAMAERPLVAVEPVGELPLQRLVDALERVSVAGAEARLVQP